MTDNEIHAKIRAGYIPPAGNLFCMNCGAVSYNCESRKRYFCARHQFYVHSMGYCPAFSTEKYVADGAKNRDPYKQTYFFKEV
jgi:hypothetical protein